MRSERNIRIPIRTLVRLGKPSPSIRNSLCHMHWMYKTPIRCVPVCVRCAPIHLSYYLPVFFNYCSYVSTNNAQQLLNLPLTFQVIEYC